MTSLRHPLTAVAGALSLTAPWVAVTVTGTALGTGATVLTSGLAVLGASFLLAWAAETAEKDVPRAFALAVLAVLAVAPEYAVDALYAWSAGAGGATNQACARLSKAAIEAAAEGQGSALAEACHDANLAIANMTGANRILIGLGWAGIAFYTVWQAHRTGDPAVTSREGFLADTVEIKRDLGTEITFLLVATAWAFAVPLRGGIGALDTLVLVGLYVAYIGIVIRGDIEETDEHVGVPAYFQQRARPVRIAVVLGLFFYAGAMIFIAVEPFAHGLEKLGLAFGVPEFFMIQWIAPLASESPELIVVAVLVTKARSTAGFNTLISSKLNQWTLLIGTLAVVYSIALGSVGTLPFDTKQAAEIWITAGQSLFALALLIDFKISLREAAALFVLFITQVIAEFYLLKLSGLPSARAEELSIMVLFAYTAVYIVAAFGLFARRWSELRDTVGVATDAARDALSGESQPEGAD